MDVLVEDVTAELGDWGPGELGGQIVCECEREGTSGHGVDEMEQGSMVCYGVCRAGVWSELGVVWRDQSRRGGTSTRTRCHNANKQARRVDACSCDRERGSPQTLVALLAHIFGQRDCWTKTWPALTLGTWPFSDHSLGSRAIKVRQRALACHRFVSL